MVYAKTALQGIDKVLEYLARYVYRIAITNNRILAIENDRVTFRYKQRREHKEKGQSPLKTMPLPVMQFMARFLQHVLPKVFIRCGISAYGVRQPGSPQDSAAVARREQS